MATGFCFSLAAKEKNARAGALGFSSEGAGRRRRVLTTTTAAAAAPRRAWLRIQKKKQAPRRSGLC
jgi:hypothetical protein